MTTQTWSSVVDHTTDAGFRAWGSELSAKFALVGLVQTADTGQINWTTVVRAASGSYAGYEIWRSADSTMFYKIEYGSIVAATSPGLRISEGQGSNGSGTLTGTLVAPVNVNCYSGAALANGAASYASYLSSTNNHLSLMWKVGSGNGGSANFPAFAFCINKTIDATGAYTNADGVILFYNSNTDAQSRIAVTRVAATATVYAASIYHTIVPGDLLNSPTQAGNFQLYNSWVSMPEMRPNIGAIAYRHTEIAAFSTFVAAQVNGVTHTYIAMGNAPVSNFFTNQNTSGMANTYSSAILYE